MSHPLLMHLISDVIVVVETAWEQQLYPYSYCLVLQSGEDNT